MVKTASFSETTSHLRQQIDEALDRYTRFDGDCPQRLAEAMRYSLLSGGKRLRPMLVLMAAQACGSREEKALPAACAVEMVHTYSLIHDDLPAMDDDDLRRGRPTCHKVYGEAMAILAGDALLTRAFELLACELSPPQVAAQCCKALGKAAGATALVGGQADDLAAEHGEQTLELLESIHARKTGALLNVSLELGAICASADQQQHAALAGYGRRLGLAFQIMDDLLDVQGDEAALGKRVGKDSDRGKLTFPGLLGIEESLRRAQALVAEACAELQPLGQNAACLEALARFVVERNR